MEKKARRCDFVHMETPSPSICASALFPSFAGVSYTSNKPPSAPTRRGDAVDALEEEEEDERLVPLLAASPLSAASDTLAADELNIADDAVEA